MSAIFGMISLDGKPIRKEGVKVFRESYEKCKIDRYLEYVEDDVLMGCALQHFTGEAENEVLPIKDDENHLLFTADCVLDNREQLMKDLAVDKKDTPDGRLIYQSYLKWGKDCVSHLRGMFAFVVYNREKKTVTLFSDHFCTRCLFYHVRDNVLYFSTLLMPMIKASGLRFRLNQTWLVDSISVLTPAMMFESRQCAYQDVWKVDAGNMVHVSLNSKPVYECFYDPRKGAKTDYSMTKERCKKELYETLFSSVKNCIRTTGEVAIQLSSGLDSSTIGCIAAPFLKEQGKNLYSYTSVPSKDSPKDESKYYVDDETEGVMKIVEAYPNIIPSFLACEGKNILNQGKRIVDIWELPCQSEQNAVWVDDIFHTASSQGCKVMLSGATGNCTVSAGSMIDALFDRIHRGHPVKGLKEYKHFCRKHHLYPKKLLKITLKEYIGNLKIKCHISDFEYKKYILTKSDLLKKCDFDRRIAKKELLNKPWVSLKKYQQLIYLPKAYAQIGEIDTKNSLAYGVLSRDPLRNVEFIDFCMKLPMEFFCNQDYDRRLVREFMQGVVPVEICTDFAHRGRQSGDNTNRIAREWDAYKSGLQDILLSETGREFFDEEKIHEKLDRLTSDNLTEHAFDMRICIDSALFVRYVKELKKYS